MRNHFKKDMNMDLTIRKLLKEKVSVQYIGHSTFLIEIGDKMSILTDPWFGKGNFILRRVKPPAVKLENIKSDIMLVTHAHEDHIDKTTLNYAKKWNPVVIGPKSVVKKAKKFDLKTVVVKPGETLDVGFKLKAVKASHPIWGGKDAVGYILFLSNCLYFAGDTLYTKEVTDDISKFDIDFAFLPIGSAKILFKKFVMDVDDAIKFALDIRPKIVIPMHYNVIKRNEANPEKMRQPLAKAGIKLKIMELGERITNLNKL